MLLLASYFGKNEGTTDFFVNYLKESNRTFYLIKLPLDASSSYSEIKKWQDGEETTLKKIKMPENFILNQLKSFWIIFKYSFLFRKKINYYIGFGSITVLPAVISKKLGLFSPKIVFYGVDFSKKRFQNKLLNKFYLYTEKIAIKNCYLAASVTKRAEEARYQLGLDKSKSIILPNGVNPRLLIKNNDTARTGQKLIFWGTLSDQSGLEQFINIYTELKINIPFVIIGSGPLENFIREEQKDNKNIVFLGSMELPKIREYLIKESKTAFLGVAPYSAKHNDHVFYGDSLKIKEYLLFNLPFLSSSDCYVSEDIKPFGYVYQNDSDLKKFIAEKLSDFINQSGALGADRDKIIDNYSWTKIFESLFIKL